MQIFDIDDAQQYLEGVWVGVKGITDDALVPYFCIFAREKELGSCSDCDVELCLSREQDQEDRIFVDCHTDCIEVDCPDLGAINLSASCFHLSRKGGRQWRRGLRSSHFYVTEKCRSFREVYTDRPCHLEAVGLDKHTADAIYNPRYMSLTAAMESIYSKTWIGVALDINFQVFLSTKSKVPLLGYKDATVGYIDTGGSAVLFDRAKHLREALNETLRIEQ